jgi:hypothetical protein
VIESAMIFSERVLSPRRGVAALIISPLAII